MTCFRLERVPQAANHAGADRGADVMPRSLRRKKSSSGLQVRDLARSRRAEPPCCSRPSDCQAPGSGWPSHASFGRAGDDRLALFHASWRTWVGTSRGARRPSIEPTAIALAPAFDLPVPMNQNQQGLLPGEAPGARDRDRKVRPICPLPLRWSPSQSAPARRALLPVRAHVHLLALAFIMMSSPVPLTGATGRARARRRRSAGCSHRTSRACPKSIKRRRGRGPTFISYLLALWATE